MSEVTTATVYAGVVERCELKSRKPFEPYIGRYDSLPTERDDFYLDVCLRLADGSAVYFKTPHARRTVACCPGAAVVTYRVEGESAKWFREETGDRGGVAVPGQSNTNRLVPLVAVGDPVSVTGRVKADKVSRAGRAYKVINYVRRTP